jgi:hypothetical protein
MNLKIKELSNMGLYDISHSNLTIIFEGKYVHDIDIALLIAGQLLILVKSNPNLICTCKKPEGLLNNKGFRECNICKKMIIRY